MKFLSSCLLLSMIVIALHGQSSILKIYAYDTAGNMDSLLFGLKDDATLGIDPDQGESNLYGTSLNDLDIRIRQRDSVSFSCGRIESLDKAVYWPQPIDSKVDFRPYTGFEGYQSNTFEVFIHCENYPVHITVDNSDIGFMNERILLTGKDENCNEYFVLGTLNADQDFITDEIDSTTPVLFFSFESYDEQYYIVDTDQVNITSNVILSVYPNPAANAIIVHSLKAGKILLYDALGRLILKSSTIEGVNEINITHFESGLYHLHHWNSEEKGFEFHTFIKK